MTSSPVPNESPQGLDANGLPPWLSFDPGWEVTPRDVRDMLERGEDLLLIDCRTPREREIAHIEGSEFVPLRELASHMEELARHEDRRVVIYCHMGQRSLQMASILRREGFEDVKSMAGGIDLWAMDIHPGMARY